MRGWRMKLPVILIAISALVYAGDGIVLGIRKSQGLVQASIVVNITYVIHQKNGKLEYLFDPPKAVPCANSLFPHEGQPACWWLARHTDQQKEITAN